MNLLGEEYNIAHHWVMLVIWYTILILDAYQDSQLIIPSETHKAGWFIRILYTLLVGYSIYGFHWLILLWMLKQGAIFYFLFNPLYNYFSDHLRYKQKVNWFRVGTTAWTDKLLWKIAGYDYRDQFGTAHFKRMDVRELWVLLAVIGIALTHLLYFWAHWKWG